MRKSFKYERLHSLYLGSNRPFMGTAPVRSIGRSCLDHGIWIGSIVEAMRRKIESKILDLQQELDYITHPVSRSILLNKIRMLQWVLDELEKE